MWRFSQEVYKETPIPIHKGSGKIKEYINYKTRHRIVDRTTHRTIDDNSDESHHSISGAAKHLDQESAQPFDKELQGCNSQGNKWANVLPIKVLLYIKH